MLTSASESIDPQTPRGGFCTLADQISPQVDSTMKATGQSSTTIFWNSRYCALRLVASVSFAAAASNSSTFGFE